MLRFDQTQKITNRYLWGPAVDQILADEQISWNDVAEEYDIESILWPLTDHRGTIRDLAEVNGSGVTEIVNTRTYDAYGKVIAESAPAVDHIFGFTARPSEGETDLQNNLNRWYDAAIGTWINEDLIGFEGGDANLYRYCGNDPVNSVDPSGLVVIELVHATPPGCAISIFEEGLGVGLDGLRWLSSPEAAGSGASMEATVHFRFEFDAGSIRDIPKSVEEAALKEAYRAAAKSGLKGAARDRLFGRVIGDYIANWIKGQPDGVYRRPNPNGSGYQYAIKGEAWKAGNPTLKSVSGKGSKAVLERMKQADKAAAAAGRGKWGDRFAGARRIGGRVLIFVAVSVSTYEIYTAENKAKEVTRQVGGWSGAWVGAKLGGYGGAKLGAGAAAVAGQLGPQVGAPEEIVTVPVCAGVGGLVGGLGGAVVGWWCGSEVTETVYEWTFEQGVQ